MQKIIGEMADAVGSDAGLDGSLKLDFGDEGSVLIDGKSVPNKVADGAGRAADCTIAMSLDTYGRMLARELDPTLAYMEGKLRVRGDMSIAMKLAPLIQRAAPTRP
ncbi:MAG: SCP2 sterol-binding domain-containing protein [Proteobacteria bacterium]|nr:SCP2 sterol-binding domain-containing protein [Pseudomonadota bacterium]